jgi:hypothetical protein
VCGNVKQVEDIRCVQALPNLYLTCWTDVTYAKVKVEQRISYVYYVRGAQIPGTRSLGQLTFVSWHLIWAGGGIVGIVTCYGLDGPEIESRWGRDFPHLSRPALGLTQRLIQWVPGLFLQGKVVRAWHEAPTPI